MLDDRLATNVDDECDPRTNLRKISKILLRPDTDIGAAGGAEVPQFVDDVKIRGLVGSEVIREKVAALFRKLIDQAGEFSGG